MEDGERAIIREIAFEVGETLMAQFKITLKDKIEHHQLTCPTAAHVTKWQGQAKTLIVGIAIGAAVVGSGGTIGVLKLLKVL